MQEPRGTLGLPCLSDVCQVTGYQDDAYILTLAAAIVIPALLAVGAVIWDKLKSKRGV